MFVAVTFIISFKKIFKTFFIATLCISEYSYYLSLSNFFRAVIHKQDIICKKPEVCKIETSARRLCRSCRYKKCLEMGMSEEGLKNFEFKITKDCIFIALQPRRDLIGRRKHKVQNFYHNHLSREKFQIQLSILPAAKKTKLTHSTAIGFSHSLLHQTKAQDLLDFIAFLTLNDKNIRLRKFEMIRSRMEAKKLAEIVKIGEKIVGFF